MCQPVLGEQFSQTVVPDGVADDREVVGDQTEAAVTRIGHRRNALRYRNRASRGDAHR